MEHDMCYSLMESENHNSNNCGYLRCTHIACHTVAAYEMSGVRGAANINCGLNSSNFFSFRFFVVQRKTARNKKWLCYFFNWRSRYIESPCHMAGTCSMCETKWWRLRCMSVLAPTHMKQVFTRHWKSGITLTFVQWHRRVDCAVTNRNRNSRFLFASVFGQPHRWLTNATSATLVGRIRVNRKTDEFTFGSE